MEVMGYDLWGLRQSQISNSRFLIGFADFETHFEPMGVPSGDDGMLRWPQCENEQSSGGTGTSA